MSLRSVINLKQKNDKPNQVVYFEFHDYHISISTFYVVTRTICICLELSIHTIFDIELKITRGSSIHGHSTLLKWPYSMQCPNQG